MHKLTGKQCKAARSLLKWNRYDLASHLGGIPPRRVESFERGIVQLAAWENDEIVKVLKRNGIEFKADFDVALSEKKGDKAIAMTAQQDMGAHITLDIDQGITEDTSLQPPPAAEDDEPEGPAR